jgi:sugar phosphate isomerase/epimerase
MATAFKTQTGGFPIGFRRGWSDWQRNLEGLTKWAKSEGFQLLDLGSDADSGAEKVVEAGLSVGSADLKSWSGLISHDPAKREEALEANADYIDACSAHGISNFFVVMLPEDPSKPRAENFEAMVAGSKALAPLLEKYGAKLVIEGWPGPGALACTPETLRALFDQVPSAAMGINYDPSHLLRMGIDPIRFVKEFSGRIYHVHGKDTEILTDRLYDLGTEQPPTFAPGIDFGGAHWRYTIPGDGHVAWTQAFEVLAEAGYQGGVSIELEDANYNGSEVGEKNGLLKGATFLSEH